MEKAVTGRHGNHPSLEDGEWGKNYTGVWQERSSYQGQRMELVSNEITTSFHRSLKARSLEARIDISGRRHDINTMTHDRGFARTRYAGVRGCRPLRRF